MPPKVHDSLTAATRAEDDAEEVRMREHPVPEDDSARGGLPSQQDDVEGHKLFADSAPGAKIDKAGIQDDDVEGHRVLSAEPGMKNDAATYRVQDDEDDDGPAISHI